MMRSSVGALLIVWLLLIGCSSAQAAGQFPVLTVSDAENGQTWSLSLQVLVLMTTLTLLPALVLAMSSFTRIIVVLAILRQALGTQQTPSNSILLGLALFLSLFVMAPVLEETYRQGIEPYLNNTMTEAEAFERGKQPLVNFMLRQTREADVTVFADIAGIESIEQPTSTPLTILIPAFVVSELKTAFQIGFLVFIPFVIIDLVVASVLMSMGMMMLSPMIISLPFKIMLFVLIDGWSLISSTLVGSFFGAAP